MRFNPALIRERLSGRLGSYFPELADSAYELRLERQTEAAYSTVCIFRVGRDNDQQGRRYGLAVKIFLPRPELGDVGMAQYAALWSVWPAFKDYRGFGVPRPLDYFADLHAMVTEEIAGESLQSLFSKHRWILGYSREFKFACHRSGEWLSMFHNATRCSPVFMDVGAKLASAKLNLAELTRLNVPGSLCVRIESMLESAARKLNDVQPEAAMVHGDFTVDNVMIADDRIVALDLSGRDRNAVYHDLATFLNSLRLLELTWPVAGYAARANSQAFVAGYFDRRHFNQTVLWFLRMAGLTATAVEIFGRRRRQPLLRFWLRRFFTRLFGEFVREGESVT